MSQPTDILGSVWHKDNDEVFTLPIKCSDHVHTKILFFQHMVHQPTYITFHDTAFHLLTFLHLWRQKYRHFCLFYNVWIHIQQFSNLQNTNWFRYHTGSLLMLMENKVSSFSIPKNLLISILIISKHRRAKAEQLWIWKNDH